jgi:hypothetical protein
METIQDRHGDVQGSMRGLPSDAVRLPSLERLQQLVDQVEVPSASGVQPESEARKVLRGVVSEVALFNETIRYPWGLMRRIYHMLIDDCIKEFVACYQRGTENELEGPFERDSQGRLVLSGEKNVAVDTEDDTCEIVMHPHDIERAKRELHELLDGFDEVPPFTLQRLSEILLEPQKQYYTLDKWLNAVEIVLSVTGSHLGKTCSVNRSYIEEKELSRVNECP